MFLKNVPNNFIGRKLNIQSEHKVFPLIQKFIAQKIVYLDIRVFCDLDVRV